MRRTTLLVTAALLFVRPVQGQIRLDPKTFTTTSPVTGTVGPGQVPGFPGLNGAAPGTLPTPGPLPASLPGMAHPLAPSAGAGLPAMPGGMPFAPALDPAGALVENLTTFDCRQAELQWTDGRWQVLAGKVLIKDVGRREADGREVLRLIRELRLNQVGRIGSPQPVMEYWLSDGRAPQGTPQGLRLLPLDVDNLRVEQVQGAWCLRNTYRTLFNFGLRPDEAQLALAIIRKYGFTQVGTFGQAGPAMLIFLSSSSAPAPAPLPAPEKLASHAAAADPPNSNNSGAATLPNGSGRAPVDPRTAGTGAPAGSVYPVGLPAGRQLGPTASGLPELASLGDRVPFDWRQVQVRKENQEWKLVFGNYVLATFGSSERDARQALAAVQFYRLTEHCLLGGSKPVFSYFLASGQAPRGKMLGVNGTSFRPEALTLRKVENNWVIFDGNQPLIGFGDREPVARQALQAIQKYRFDQICHIGPPDLTGLTFFVRTR